MNALALTPGTTNIRLVDRLEPQITTGDQIKLRVIAVGICGTDREEVSGGRADAPPGQNELIIGHEMFGQVVEVGSAVQEFEPGDYAAFTVRRGCGHCPACLTNRSDMCYTGDYTERGIKQRDGYQAEFVVDAAQYAVKVPAEMASIGVLSEPMSVTEKAIDEVLRIQTARLPDQHDPEHWLEGKQVLVAGLGAIGLLASFALRLRGADVLGLDIVESDSIRPTILREIGGQYVDGRSSAPDTLDDRFGDIDLILEATGVANLEFDLLAALGINGIYVLTGIPGGDRPLKVDGPALMRRLVLRNQVMVGSVNASRKHFEMAVHDLNRARRTWGSAIERVITDRYPYTDYSKALSHHSTDEIKTILEWSKPATG
jgi:threonine dehydrogenase-like Zn-dependent dehydrogenase